MECGDVTPLLFLSFVSFFCFFLLFLSFVSFFCFFLLFLSFVSFFCFFLLFLSFVSFFCFFVWRGSGRKRKTGKKTRKTKKQKRCYITALHKKRNSKTWAWGRGTATPFSPYP